MSSAMTSLKSSSRRSSSSFHSSSCYSTSSSFRSEGSLGGSSDSLDPLFEPFLDSGDYSSLFGEEGTGSSNCMTSFGKQSRPSFGQTAPAGGTSAARQSSIGGGVRCLGDCYYMSADVSQFEPQDIVVMAYNHHVVVHAEKIHDDGSVSDTFTHKTLFPENMDPLSVSGYINLDGTLVVSVQRTTALGELEPLRAPIYRSEAHL